MTIFIEIIQRIGCDVSPEGHKIVQAAGCGGFGKVSKLLRVVFFIFISFDSTFLIQLKVKDKKILLLMSLNCYINSDFNIVSFLFFSLTWKGNFSELFKSIEDFEKSQENVILA